MMGRMYGFVAVGGFLRRAQPAYLRRSPCVRRARARTAVGASGAWCCAERAGIATATTTPRTEKQELPVVSHDGNASSITPMGNIIDVLQERGLFDAGTGDMEILREHCSKPIVVYVGFDPTADSLHLGNLLALITLGWFQRCGHQVVALLGGATGRIGDPSGKSIERPVLSESALEGNIRGIESNIRVLLGDDAIIVNNYDWISSLTFLDFLRDVGRHARVNTMLGKESVKKRIESSDGISYTEFTYQLIQGYDFMHLNSNYSVTMQIGGADQWGNITAGTELTRRLCSRQVHGVTFPLLTTADGKKFGKSESGAIWLSSDKLSPYEFYQHLFRTADADIDTFLRRLTFMPIGEIQDVVESMKQPSYKANDAQRVLASEVTRMVHGEQGLKAALAATEAVKPGGDAKLTLDALIAISADMPSVSLPPEDVLETPILQLMVTSGLLKSKGEARRLLKNGGVYLNNVKMKDEKAIIQNVDLVGNSMLLLAAGKKNKLLVRVDNDA